jgi:hypothetical protein
METGNGIRFHGVGAELHVSDRHHALRRSDKRSYVRRKVPRGTSFFSGSQLLRSEKFASGPGVQAS